MLSRLKYNVGKVVRVTDEAEDIKSFYIKVKMEESYPGQFVMVWLPGFEEIPLSPSLHEQKILRLTVAAVGSTTRKMHGLNIGDRVFIRGPYGRGFNINHKGKYLLIAGGYGAAPLIYALRKLREAGKHVAYAIGAKTSSKLLFVNEAKNLGAKVYIATDDGSRGFKGYVTEMVQEIIENYDNILACGPEKMLYRVMEMCLKTNVKCQLSIERYIKCGIGICGSCALDPKGLLVCKDGPVFYVEELVGTDFGKYYTLPSGTKKPI